MPSECAQGACNVYSAPSVRDGQRRTTVHTMTCAICHGSDLGERTVNETLWVGRDVVLVPCRVLVCNNCGERYYNRQVMRYLEEVEEHIQARTLALEIVGQVLRIASA